MKMNLRSHGSIFFFIFLSWSFLSHLHLDGDDKKTDQSKKWFDQTTKRKKMKMDPCERTLTTAIFSSISKKSTAEKVFNFE